jgi:hypothetical protein
MDVAMMPVREGDFDALEMFTATAAARAAVEKRKRKLAAAAGELVSAGAGGRSPLQESATHGRRAAQPEAGRNA